MTFPPCGASSATCSRNRFHQRRRSRGRQIALQKLNSLPFDFRGDGLEHAEHGRPPTCCRTSVPRRPQAPAGADDHRRSEEGKHHRGGPGRCQRVHRQALHGGNPFRKAREDFREDGRRRPGRPRDSTEFHHGKTSQIRRIRRQRRSCRRCSTASPDPRRRSRPAAPRGRQFAASASVAGGDDDDLQALFDTVRRNTPPNTTTTRSPPVRPVPTAADNVFNRIGVMTRQLHDTLRELGYDRSLQEAPTPFPMPASAWPTSPR